MEQLKVIFSANQNAGFSIVKWSGSGADATVGAWIERNT